MLPKSLSGDWNGQMQRNLNDSINHSDKIKSLLRCCALKLQTLDCDTGLLSVVDIYQSIYVSKFNGLTLKLRLYSTDVLWTLDSN